MEVTQCAGRVSANTRRHQLRWGDREWAYHMSCTSCAYMYNHVYVYPVQTLSLPHGCSYIQLICVPLHVRNYSLKLSLSHLRIESCRAVIDAWGLNCRTVSRATSTLGRPTWDFRNRNCRFKLLTSIVSKSI